MITTTRRPVFPGVRRNTPGDLGNVSRVGFENGLDESLGFGFIPDDVVRVEEDMLQLGTTETGDERHKEVEDKGLCVWASGLGGVSERYDDEGGQGGLPCYSPMRAC